ncbi:sensor protein ZraS [Escherichia coli]|uniref:Sensor protein ZraS n=1 Tax=Escherichia coli TaxID=562 RepID=A0A2X3KKA0_ECOLX|nr:sensor protein ZraS [Escherichia coli]
MRFMQRSKDSLAKWLSAILPVVIVGLVGLFAVTVIRDYGRETAAARQTLLEKGSVLIRALESGSRVGMGCACIMRSSRPYWKKWPGSLEYVGLRSRMNKEQS